MVRFARASGSKGSNEKTPEEASSWQEMKKSMLRLPVKNDKQATVVNEHSYNDVEIPSAHEIETVWADLVAEAGGKKLSTSLGEYNVEIKQKKSDKCVGDDVSTTKPAVMETLVTKSKKNKVELSQKMKLKKKNKKILQKATGDVEDMGKHKIKATSLLNQGEISEDTPLNEMDKKRKINKIDQNSEDGSPDIIKKKKVRKIAIDNLTPEKKKRKIVVTAENDVNRIPIQKPQKKKKRKADQQDNQPINNGINCIPEKISIDGGKKKKNKRDAVAEDAANNQPIKKSLKKERRKTELQDNQPITSGSNCIGEIANNSGKMKKSKTEAVAEDAINNQLVQSPLKKSRRKAELQETQVIINGRPVKLTPYDGFMILAEDADRLKILRKSLIEKGIGKLEREKVMKLERRRAEKVLQRLKRQVCFHCRGTGHVLSECPLIQKDEGATGICYKCGSTEHTHYQCRVSRGEDFRYAECFICKERGHIAKQCPDNPRGLYPRGGACATCGDVTHLKKDCPKYVAEQQEEKFTVGTRDNRCLEALDDEVLLKTERISVQPKRKHIKFE